MAKAISSPECMPPCGMSVVVEPEDPDIDVVFVHGFTGHPYRTWVSKTRGTNGTSTPEPDTDHHPPPAKRLKILGGKKKGIETSQVYWPRDILPLTMPRARVMAYGYDTKLRHSMGPQGSQSTIFGYAKELLDSLNDRRSSSKRRPLMFIVHSLGGIVVKEALRQASKYDNSPVERDLYDIFQSTLGIIFFGTPHRGADPRGLVHRIIQEVIEILGVSANKHVVNTLMPDSERLKELLVEFANLAQSRDWAIWSFQEQHGVRALGGRKVVEDNSSCLGDGRIEKIRPIDANHMDMCRFSDPNDPQYRKVDSALRAMDSHRASRMLEDQEQKSSPESPSETIKSRRLSDEKLDDLVQRLKFDQIDARLANLKPPKAKTCSWVLKSPNYIQWRSAKYLSEHHGFFWIKGKPGAGKSILMKYLFSNAKRSFPQAKTISFFFNARGETLERSTIGLYRSLLWQIFEKAPGLKWLLGEALGSSKVHGHEWPLQVLKNIFELVVEQLRDEQLTCYIDALDECPEDEIRDMVYFLEEICAKAADSGSCLRICFASRHYPHITIKRGLHMDLENENKHTEDIKQYVESELNIGSSKRALSLKETLISKTEGVFLWVALVIPMLRKAYDHGLQAVEKKLRNLPPKLSDLFHDILTRDSEDRDGLLLSIQWVLFAERPMRLQELHFAIEAGRESCDVEDLKTDPESEAEDSVRFIRLRLLSTSKGLIEETRSKNPTMQFIHESVRDYLLKEKGLLQLWSELGDDPVGKSHEHLSRYCLRQVQLIPKPLNYGSKETKNESCVAFPFAEYASKNVFFHADVAQSRGVSQSQFLTEFPVGVWIQCHNIFETKMSRQYQEDTSLLYILAEQDLVDLVRIHPDKMQHMNIRSGRYRLPFLAAFACGKSRVAEYLGHQYFLDIEPRITVTREENFLPSTLSTNREIKIKDDKLAEACARLGCATALEYMILQGDVSGVKGEYGALLASETNSSHVFRVLLHYGLDPNSRESTTHGRPIFFNFLRAQYQPLELLKTICSNGQVKLCAVDNVGDTALHDALKTLWLNNIQSQAYDVFQFVLQTFGIDVNTKNRAGRTPLSLAVDVRESVSCRLIELLLQCHDLKPDLEDSHGRTPLSYAAENGYLQISKLLLELDEVEPDSRDGQGRTPLSYAAASYLPNDCEITKMILRYASTPDVVDDQGWTPLFHAASRGRSRLVAFLVEDGRFDCSALDVLGRNALHVALLMQGNFYGDSAASLLIKIRHLLRSKKVDPSQVDSDGISPLKMMQSLLDKHRDTGKHHQIAFNACMQMMKDYHQYGEIPVWGEDRDKLNEYLEEGGYDQWHNPLHSI